MSTVNNAFPYFPEAGTNGYIYIGAANQDAQTNPITVYRDAALTLPWAQPIRTLNGYPAYQGAQGEIYTAASSWSITVKDANQRIVSQDTSASSFVTSASLAAAGGAGMIGFLQAGTGAVSRSVESKLRDVVNVDDFKLASDTDDVGAITRALTYCNSLVRTGLASTIKHPGATLVWPNRVLNLASITGPFQILCNTRDTGCALSVPASYSGQVLSVGYSTAGDNLAGANIEIPAIYKPNGSAMTGTAVRLVNLNACTIKFCGRINYFQYGIHAGGIGEGTVYCDIYLNQLAYCLQLLRIAPGSGGWFNTNRVSGGNLRQGGNRVTGQFHVYMDGSSPATAIVGNTFIGGSYEGGGAEYVVYAKNAYGNTWLGTYNETQNAIVAVTVSGDTLTSTAHGMSVDDVIYLFASVLPTGMRDLTPYYVVSVPTADTFKIALARGGAAITFGSSGTSVKYIRQSRCYFDGTGGLVTLNNRFINMLSPPSVGLDMIQAGVATNNGADASDYMSRSVNNANDFPLFRGRQQSFAAATRVAFAAYPAAVNPEDNPTGWTTGLADQGVMFQSGGAEIGRLFSSAGVLFYEANNSGALFELPTAKRPPSLTTLGTTSVPASDRTIVTLTLTGVAVGDYVVPHTYSALPDGIAIAWARVSAADTVQICFYNWKATATDITGVQLKALVYRASL